MTANRRSKRAIRSRMAQTGEKYTKARRALLASGGDSGGAGDDPGVMLARPAEAPGWLTDQAYSTIRWPEDWLGWLTDQAHNAILLADDEARMLSHPPGAPGIFSPDPRHENVLEYAQPPYSRATGIFSSAARRVVAEDVLTVAERLGHKAITTGHVLIALLERPGEHASEIISSLPAAGEISAAVIDALPGQEDT